MDVRASAEQDAQRTGQRSHLHRHEGVVPRRLSQRGEPLCMEELKISSTWSETNSTKCLILFRTEEIRVPIGRVQLHHDQVSLERARPSLGGRVRRARRRSGRRLLRELVLEK